jgi:hypothetical protein
MGTYNGPQIIKQQWTQIEELQLAFSLCILSLCGNVKSFNHCDQLSWKKLFKIQSKTG